MPFTANEVLVAAKPIPKDDLEELSGLKSLIASSLGSDLKTSYKWTRPVVVNFKAYDKLGTSKKLKGKTGLKWQLKVDAKVKNVLFVVSEGSKALEEIEILDLSKIVEQAVVVNLQGGDDTMDSASSKQANKFNNDSNAKGTYKDPHGKEVDEQKVSLKKINTRKKIVLCGHGGGDDVSGTDEKYTANEFGGRNAEEIVKFLIKQGLSTSYKGTIYLSGCHTAAGYTDPKSFASVVQKEMAKKGYKDVSFAGTPGEAWTKDDGDKGSIPAVYSEELQKTRDRSAKLLGDLKEALKKGKEELDAAELQDKNLETQYQSVSDLINEMPPEARDTLSDKLLKPIQGDRDELTPALERMRQANKTLAGAIKTETEYLEKLDRLLKDKKKLAEGKIDKSEYQRREEALFTVEEWWGHFGPARATSAKVGKNQSKIKQLTEAFRSKLKKK